MSMICFDTETGGLNARCNGLCSVTLKEIGKDNIITIFIKPNKELHYSKTALRVNGLSLEELEKIGISEDECVKKIIEFVNDIKSHNNDNVPGLVAHNMSFDNRFMEALFLRNVDIKFKDLFSGKEFDTMYRFGDLIKLGLVPKMSKKLMNVYEYLFNEKFDDAHTSEADVIATERVYEELKKRFDEMKIKDENRDENFLD